MSTPNTALKNQYPCYFENVNPKDLTFDSFFPKKSQSFNMSIKHEASEGKKLPAMFVTPFVRIISGDQAYPYGNFVPHHSNKTLTYPAANLKSACYRIPISPGEWNEAANDDPEARNPTAQKFFDWISDFEDCLVEHIVADKKLATFLRENCQGDDDLRHMLKSSIKSPISLRKKAGTKIEIPGSEYAVMERYLFDPFKRQTGNEASGVCDPLIREVLKEFQNGNGQFCDLKMVDCGTKLTIPWDERRLSGGDVVAIRFQIRVQESLPKTVTNPNQTFSLGYRIRIKFIPHMIFLYRSSQQKTVEVGGEKDMEEVQGLDFGVSEPVLPCAPKRVFEEDNLPALELDEKQAHDYLFGSGAKRKSPSRAGSRSGSQSGSREDNNDDDDGHSAYSLEQKKRRTDEEDDLETVPDF